MFKHLFIVFSFLLFNIGSMEHLHAATVFASDDEDSIVSFKDRFALRTNVIDWLLVTPNIGIEYDIVHDKYNKISLNFSSKYNWNSSQKMVSRYVYNIAEGKAELRWYWRTQKISDAEREWVNDPNNSFVDKMGAKWYSRRYKEKPRRNRAYYFGPYIVFDNYSIKLGNTGYQGNSLGAGVSFGFNTSLYTYDNGTSIDFETGISAGLAVTEYDTYGYDAENNCYPHQKSKGIHLVPFPVISDLRVGFVFRFNSIKNQLTEIDYQKVNEMNYFLELREYAQRNNEFQIDTLYFTTYNKQIARKNDEIKRYKHTIEKEYQIDSTLQLEYLHPLLPYAQTPKNMRTLGFKKRVNNIGDIQSARELKVVFVEELLNGYSALGETELDKKIVDIYNQLRQGGKSSISEYEFLIDVVTRVNEMVREYNQFYGGGSEGSNNQIAIYTRYRTPKSNQDTCNNYFLEKSDTIYLKATAPSVQSENDRIESKNKIKRIGMGNKPVQKKETENSNNATLPENRAIVNKGDSNNG